MQKSGAGAENARDISQDVLVKMLESEIILPFEEIRAWMYRVAIRLLIAIGVIKSTGKFYKENSLKMKM